MVVIFLKRFKNEYKYSVYILKTSWRIIQSHRMIFMIYPSSKTENSEKENYCHLYHVTIFLKDIYTCTKEMSSFAMVEVEPQAPYVLGKYFTHPSKS